MRQPRHMQVHAARGPALPQHVRVHRLRDGTPDVLQRRPHVLICQVELGSGQGSPRLQRVCRRIHQRQQHLREGICGRDMGHAGASQPVVPVAGGRHAGVGRLPRAVPFRRVQSTAAQERLQQEHRRPRGLLRELHEASCFRSVPKRHPAAHPAVVCGRELQSSRRKSDPIQAQAHVVFGPGPDDTHKHPRME